MTAGSEIKQSAQIGEGTQISQSTIEQGSEIGSNTRVINSRLGNEVTVGKDSHVHTATVDDRVSIGECVAVNKGVTVKLNATIYNEVTVDADVGAYATVLSRTNVTRSIPDYGVALPQSAEHVVQGDRQTRLTNWIIGILSR